MACATSNALMKKGTVQDRVDSKEDINAMLALRLASTLSETKEYRQLASSLRQQVATVREELDRMLAEDAAVGAKRDAARLALVEARKRLDTARAAKSAVGLSLDRERMRFPSSEIDKVKQMGGELQSVQSDVASVRVEIDELARTMRQLRDEIEHSSRAKQHSFNPGSSIQETALSTSESPSPHAEQMSQAPSSDVSRIARPADSQPFVPAVEKTKQKKTKPKRTARAEEVITIRVIDVGSGEAPETFYRTKRNRPIRRIAETHAGRKGVALSAVAFRYRGQILEGAYNETPQTLGLQDLALFECSLKTTAKHHSEIQKPTSRVLFFDEGSGAFGRVSSQTAVVLLVRDMGRSKPDDLFYSIDRHDRFEALFIAHARRRQIPPSLLSFFTPGGQRQIFETHTPGELGLSDLSRLECVLAVSNSRPAGGHRKGSADNVLCSALPGGHVQAKGFFDTVAETTAHV